MSAFTFDELIKFEPEALNKLASAEVVRSLTPEQRGDIEFIQKVHQLVDQAHTNEPTVIQEYGKVRSELTGQIDKLSQERQIIRNTHFAQYEKGNKFINWGYRGGTAAAVLTAITLEH